MRLNHDCIRDVMLAVENDLQFTRVSILRLADETDNFLRENDLPKYKSEDLLYTTSKLIEAGYLNGVLSETDQLGIENVYIDSITWEGHNFLDTVRDPKIWKATKKIVSHLESVSITILSKVGTGVLNHVIDKYMPTNLS